MSYFDSDDDDDDDDDDNLGMSVGDVGAIWTPPVLDFLTPAITSLDDGDDDDDDDEGGSFESETTEELEMLRRSVKPDKRKPNQQSATEQLGGGHVPKKKSKSPGIWTPPTTFDFGNTDYDDGDDIDGDDVDEEEPAPSKTEKKKEKKKENDIDDYEFEEDDDDEAEDAEIRRLIQLGTQTFALEAMYSKEAVARVMAKKERGDDDEEDESEEEGDEEEEEEEESEEESEEEETDEEEEEPVKKTKSGDKTPADDHVEDEPQPTTTTTPSDIPGIWTPPTTFDFGVVDGDDADDLELDDDEDGDGGGDDDGDLDITPTDTQAIWTPPPPLDLGKYDVDEDDDDDEEEEEEDEEGYAESSKQETGTDIPQQQARFHDEPPPETARLPISKDKAGKLAGIKGHQRSQDEYSSSYESEEEEEDESDEEEENSPQPVKGALPKPQPVESKKENVVEEVSEKSLASSSSSSEASYQEHVVQKWIDRDTEPDDYEAAVTALASIVFQQDEAEDFDGMKRRMTLPEQYKYLKQQYWYKIHTGQAPEDEVAAKKKASRRATVDDRLEMSVSNLLDRIKRGEKFEPPSKSGGLSLSQPDGDTAGKTSFSSASSTPVEGGNKLKVSLSTPTAKKPFPGSLRSVQESPEHEEEDAKPEAAPTKSTPIGASTTSSHSIASDVQPKASDSSTELQTGQSISKKSPGVADDTGATSTPQQQTKKPIFPLPTKISERAAMFDKPSAPVMPPKQQVIYSPSKSKISFQATSPQRFSKTINAKPPRIPDLHPETSTNSPIPSTIDKRRAMFEKPSAPVIPISSTPNSKAKDVTGVPKRYGGDQIHIPSEKNVPGIREPLSLRSSATPQLSISDRLAMFEKLSAPVSSEQQPGAPPWKHSLPVATTKTAGTRRKIEGAFTSTAVSNQDETVENNILQAMPTMQSRDDREPHISVSSLKTEESRARAREDAKVYSSKNDGGATDHRLKEEQEKWAKQFKDLEKAMAEKEQKLTEANRKLEEIKEHEAHQQLEGAKHRDLFESRTIADGLDYRLPQVETVAFGRHFSERELPPLQDVRNIPSFQDEATPVVRSASQSARRGQDTMASQSPQHGETDANIIRLFNLGTSTEILEDMFGPDEVRKALSAQSRRASKIASVPSIDPLGVGGRVRGGETTRSSENVGPEMDEGANDEASAFSDSDDLSVDAVDFNIRRMSELGMEIRALEAMFHPDDVARVLETNASNGSADGDGFVAERALEGRLGASHISRESVLLGSTSVFDLDNLEDSDDDSGSDVDERALERVNQEVTSSNDEPVLSEGDNAVRPRDSARGNSSETQAPSFDRQNDTRKQGERHVVAAFDADGDAIGEDEASRRAAVFYLQLSQNSIKQLDEMSLVDEGGREVHVPPKISVLGTKNGLEQIEKEALPLETRSSREKPVAKAGSDRAPTVRQHQQRQQGEYTRRSSASEDDELDDTEDNLQSSFVGLQPATNKQPARPSLYAPSDEEISTVSEDENFTPKALRKSGEIGKAPPSNPNLDDMQPRYHQRQNIGDAYPPKLDKSTQIQGTFGNEVGPVRPTPTGRADPTNTGSRVDAVNNGHVSPIIYRSAGTSRPLSPVRFRSIRSNSGDASKSASAEIRPISPKTFHGTRTVRPGSPKSFRSARTGLSEHTADRSKGVTVNEEQLTLALPSALLRESEDDIHACSANLTAAYQEMIKRQKGEIAALAEKVVELQRLHDLKEHKLHQANEQKEIVLAENDDFRDKLERKIEECNELQRLHDLNEQVWKRANERADLVSAENIDLRDKLGRRTQEFNSLRENERNFAKLAKEKSDLDLDYNKLVSRTSEMKSKLVNNIQSLAEATKEKVLSDRAREDLNSKLIKTEQTLKETQKDLLATKKTLEKALKQKDLKYERKMEEMKEKYKTLQDELVVCSKAKDAKTQQLDAEKKKGEDLGERLRQSVATAAENQRLFQQADAILNKFASEKEQLQRNILIERQKEAQRLHDAHEQSRQLLNEKINNEKLLKDKEAGLLTLQQELSQKEQQLARLRRESAEKEAEVPILQEELIRRKAHIDKLSAKLLAAEEVSKENDRLLRTSTEKLFSATAERDVLQAKMLRSVDAMNGASTKIATLTNENQSLRNRLSEAKLKSAKVSDELQRLKIKDDERAQQVKEANEKSDSLFKKLEKATDRAIKAQAQSRELPPFSQALEPQIDMNMINSVLAESETEIQACAVRLNDLNHQNRLANQEIHELKRSLGDCQKALTDQDKEKSVRERSHRDEKQGLESKLKSLAEKMAALSSENRLLEKNLAQSVQTCDEFQDALKAANAKVSDLKEQLRDERHRNEKLEDKLERTTDEADEYKHLLEEARDKLNLSAAEKNNLNLSMQMNLIKAVEGKKNSVREKEMMEFKATRMEQDMQRLLEERQKSAAENDKLSAALSAATIELAQFRARNIATAESEAATSIRLASLELDLAKSRQEHESDKGKLRQSEDECKEVKASLVAMEIKDIELKENFDRAVRAREASLAALEAKRGIEKQLADASNENESLRQLSEQLTEALRGKTKDFARDKKALMDAVMELETEVADAASKSETLQKELDAIKLQRKNLLADLDRSKREQVLLQQAKESHKLASDESEVKLKSLQAANANNTSRFQDEIQARDEHLRHLASECAKLQNSNDTLTSALVKAEDTVRKLGRSLENLQAEKDDDIRELDADRAALVDEKYQLRHYIDAQKAKLVALQGEMKAAKNARARADLEKRELQELLPKLTQQAITDRARSPRPEDDSVESADSSDYDIAIGRDPPRPQFASEMIQDLLTESKQQQRGLDPPQPLSAQRSTALRSPSSDQRFAPQSQRRKRPTSNAKEHGAMDTHKAARVSVQLMKILNAAHKSGSGGSAPPAQPLPSALRPSKLSLPTTQAQRQQQVQSSSATTASLQHSTASMSDAEKDEYVRQRVAASAAAIDRANRMQEKISGSWGGDIHGRPSSVTMRQ